MMDEFYCVCTKKLKLNARKSMLMVFEGKEVQVVDLNTLYRMSVSAVERCELVLGGEKMEVKELNYFGNSAIQTWRDGMKIRKKAVKGKCVIGSLSRNMRGNNILMEVKRVLRNSILLPTLPYGSQTWTRNKTQLSSVHSVEMCYLRGSCSLTKWEGESNGSMYERCEMV